MEVTEGNQQMQPYRPYSGESPELRALRDALNAGEVDRETWLAAVHCQRGPSHWLSWAQFWLRSYGLALLLAGVVFFFAYNWADMHRFEKFGLIQLGLVGTVMLAWRQGWRSVSGQAFLIAATVLVGVLMAVFGQVYQTGADAWQLFFSWSMLVLPWVLVANSAALWVLWLVIAETAIATWSHTGGFSIFHARWAAWMCVGSLLPLALLAVRETMLLTRKAWLADAWLRPVLVLMALGLLSVPAFSAIIFTDTRAGWLLPWLAAAITGFAVYRWIIPDILQLTFVVFNAAAVVIVMVGRLLVETDGGIEILWLIALTIIAGVSAAYFWLRRLAEEIARNKDATAEENFDESH